MEFEELVRDLVAYGIAVDLLVAQISNSVTRYGVRLRPFAKKLPRDKMVLGSGPTYLASLKSAVEKAEDGRWENLEWASRPWDQIDFAQNPKRFGV